MIEQNSNDHMISNPGADNKLARLIRAVTIAGLVGLGLSLFIHKIIDTDIWWHLRTGSQIVATHGIPGFDSYSYIAGGNRWIDLHWLFQVILHGVHGAAGAYGVSFLFISLFSLTFVILWRTSAKEKYFPTTVFLFWSALMACSTRFLARPEAFTFLMIAIYISVLSRYERGGARWPLYLLIPLQVIWTNLQGLFIIGPFLIFAYAAGLAADPLIPRRKERVTGEDAPNMRPLLLVLAGSLLACLVNPYGIEGALFPFTLFTRVGGVQNIFARSIAEFQPPFSGYNLTSSIVWFGVFLAVSAALTVLNFKNLRIHHVIIFSALAYLALNARRNIPIFVLAFLPPAVTHGSEIAERLRRVKEERFSPAIEYGGLACCVIMSIAFILQITTIVSNEYYLADKRAERFGIGFKEQTHPRGPFVFIKEQGIRGPFFNNLDIGGMFIYELFPEERVLIDARLEVNSAEAFSEYRRAMSDAGAFASLSRKYAFNAVVISHVAQDALFLMPVLYFSPEWVLVYLDPLAAVFVRVASEHRTIIDEYRIDLAVDHVEPLASHDTVNDSSPRWLRKILSVGEREAAPQNRFNLGLVFLVTGHYERAIEEFEAGLALRPNSPEAYYNLGLAYEGADDPEAAMEHYLKAIEIDSRHGLAHANLGRMYDLAGFKEKAEREYKLAVKLEKNNPVLNYNLGAFYYERGDYESARIYWERALRADPSFTPAIDGLKKIE
jgi:Tfp pilus assembly protein PilF